MEMLSCIQISIRSALGKLCMQKKAYSRRPRLNKHCNFASENVSGILYLQFVSGNVSRKPHLVFIFSITKNRIKC